MKYWTGLHLIQNYVSSSIPTVKFSNARSRESFECCQNARGNKKLPTGPFFQHGIHQYMADVDRKGNLVEP